MNEQNPISVRNFEQISIAVAKSAIEERNAALEAAEQITKVQDEFSVSMAARARNRLYALQKSMESSRKEAKAPVLDFGREIDLAAKQFVGPIADRMDRIDRLIADYWRRVKAEKERREREAREAAEKAEAEARRRAAEAEAAEKARSEQQESSGSEGAAAPASRSFSDIVKTTASAKAAADARLEAQELARAKPSEAISGSGMTVVSRKDFKVVDLAELAAKHPDFVTITVKRQAVLSAIKEGREVSGIRVFETSKARATGGGR